MKKHFKKYLFKNEIPMNKNKYREDSDLESDEGEASSG